MKKLFLSIAPLALVISGCSFSINSNGDKLNIAAPKGAPAVALYKHVLEENVEVIADASVVLGYLSANSNKDVVIAPTNAGVKAIVEQQAPFKLAATVTFGNFFVCATGNDEDGIMNGDDYVVVFQQNNVPDKVFQYTYSDLELSNIHYVKDATVAGPCLLTGKDATNDNATVDYVLLAQPAVNTVIANAAAKGWTRTVYSDVQKDFKEKSGNKEITQASIFIKNSVSKAKANKFLEGIKEDVEEFLADPTTIDSYFESTSEEIISSKFSADLTTLKLLTSNGKNGMGIGFKYALANKAAIDNFLGLFNIGETSEEIYHK